MLLAFFVLLLLLLLVKAKSRLSGNKTTALEQKKNRLREKEVKKQPLPHKGRKLGAANAGEQKQRQKTKAKTKDKSKDKRQKNASLRENDNMGGILIFNIQRHFPVQLPCYDF